MDKIIISKDLLEILIEMGEDWVGQNEWRRNTTIRNHRLLIDNEASIIEARKLLKNETL